jgi:HAMP domain-containing protein
MAKPQEPTQTSDSASPHYTFRPERDIVLIAAALLLLLLTFVAATYFRQSRRLNRAFEVYNRHRDKIDAAKFAAPVNRGEVISVGTWEWTLVEAKEKGKVLQEGSEGSSQCVAGDGNRFIEVRFVVKNNENRRYELKDIALLDGNKNIYRAYSPALQCIDKNYSEASLYRDSGETTVAKNEQKELTAFYRVPERTGNFRLLAKEYADAEITDFTYLYLGF